MFKDVYRDGSYIYNYVCSQNHPVLVSVVFMSVPSLHPLLVYTCMCCMYVLMTTLPIETMHVEMALIC